MRRKDHARVRFGSLLRLRNVVGLLREQYDPSGGHGLGNMPHGHAHAYLINAAHVLL